MKKTISICVLTCIAAVFMAMTAFAGTWEGNNASGWKLKKPDGTYVVNAWFWDDSDHDGWEECFYFDKDGILALNTTIDSWLVNGLGQWVDKDGKVQLQAVAGGPAGTAAQGNEANKNSSLDEYAAKLTYTGVYGTETAKIYTDGNLIVFDVTLPWKAAECPSKWLEDTYYDGEHYKVMQNISSDALKFYGSQRDVVENIYSSDGQLLKSYKYFGRPMG